MQSIAHFELNKQAMDLGPEDVSFHVCYNPPLPYKCVHVNPHQPQQLETKQLLCLRSLKYMYMYMCMCAYSQYFEYSV